MVSKSSFCSTSSPAFVVISILGGGHSNRCLVVSHCYFNFPFSDNLCVASFHMLIFHLYLFFNELSVNILCLFFFKLSCFLIFSRFKRFLHSLHKNLLSAMSFTNISSHSFPRLFVLLILFAQRSF